jgi:predicted RNA methylase
MAYGTHTGGLIPSFLLTNKFKKNLDRKLYFYIGCQPTCLRAAIEFVGITSEYDFYDLGCGMGRATIIAREYNFRSIIGVEISPDLCKIAVQNAAIVSDRYPGRTAIQICNADAESFVYQSADAMVFLYHPFGVNILRSVVESLARLVESGNRVVIIYENPVHFDVIDSFTAFSRQYGMQVAWFANEQSHHLDDDESVSVWASFPVSARISRGFTFNVTKPGWRVEVVNLN